MGWILLLGFLLGLSYAEVPDACTLLTQAEAEVVLGKASKVIKDATPYQSLCAYQLPQPAANGLVRVQVDLYVGPLKLGGQTLDGKAMFARGLDFLRQTAQETGSMLSDFKTSPLKGFGDEALSFQNTLTFSRISPDLAGLKAYNAGILVRKGDRVLAVQLAGLQPPRLEVLRPLAQRALSRLP